MCSVIKYRIVQRTKEMSREPIINVFIVAAGEIFPEAKGGIVINIGMLTSKELPVDIIIYSTIYQITAPATLWRVNICPRAMEEKIMMAEKNVLIIIYNMQNTIKEGMLIPNSAKITEQISFQTAAVSVNMLKSP